MSQIYNRQNCHDQMFFDSIVTVRHYNEIASSIIEHGTVFPQPKQILEHFLIVYYIVLSTEITTTIFCPDLFCF